MTDKELMQALLKHAARINGSVKSKKKALAARKNGKKGGRPRNRKTA